MARKRDSEERPKAAAEEAEKRIEEARRTGAYRLDLSELGLTALPESIGQLSQLQTLYLHDNQLTALPESIAQLSQLQRVYLYQNKLTALPESIGRLAQLQELSLWDNQVRALPESIGRLSQLQWLDLQGNKLTALPVSIGRLSQLQGAYLHANGLQTLPNTIGQLGSLERLWLSDNDLRALPDAIRQLGKLEQLYLHGNDRLGIPPEILGPTWLAVHVRKEAESAKPADILQYYFRTRREAKRRLNEAKVLLVGQGAVGKTSLVKRLVYDEYDEQEPKTEGIDIVTWEVAAAGDTGQPADQIRLNIWDFGGQEIMHATHQFFLTKRSLYLVVLDARKGENESNIHYWLKIIQSYGGDAPVLVVTNKHEPPNRLDLNETRLALDYAPNVRGFLKVSAKTGDGIPELRAAIAEQINALPHVSDELPGSYFEVKERLEAQARSDDYIDLAEYRQLCRQHGVSDKRDQDILIRFLHDLGNVLNFDDPADPYELRDTNILNPEWVTGGVYKIVNDNALMRGGGVLEASRLGGILSDHDRYPPPRHKFIIEMMRKFELCFDFPDSLGQRVLIPELLSPNEPDLNWPTGEALNFEYHYKVLPGGIICRFIVRMHYNLTAKPTYWRSGVVLEVEGNRALVRGDTQAGRVYISVLGPPARRRRALSVIRDAFKAIHATVPRLDAQEKVPLPDNPGVVVDYQHLCKLEERGIDAYLPEGADDECSVSGLLNGIEERDQRVEEQERQRDGVGVQPRPSAPPMDLNEQPSAPARSKLDLKTFLVVGSSSLFALIVLVGVLALVSKYVESTAAMTAITVAGLLFAVLFFVFLARFTGMLPATATERIVDKILDKVPKLKRDRSPKPEVEE